MSAKRITGKFTGEHIVTAAVLSMGQGEYTDRISDAIRLAATRNPGGVKYVARAANSNIRTVESWLAKRSTPTGLHLLRLMASVPEIQAEVRRLAGMDANLDPEIERGLHDIMQRMDALRRLER